MAKKSPTHPPAPGKGPALQGLRVFVSYPRGGGAHTWAEQVHADLSTRGAVVSRDEQAVAEGDADWVARIREGLERADVVACVVGAESDACRWQQREMLRADQLALPVVAFRTAAVALPFYMIEKQPVELRDARAPAASFEMLARALARAPSRLAMIIGGTASTSARRRATPARARLPRRAAAWQPVGP